MLKTKRLDKVLARQRKSLVVDALVATVLVIGLAIAVLAFAMKVPAMVQNDTAASDPIVTIDTSPARVTAAMIDTNDDSLFAM